MKKKSKNLKNNSKKSTSNSEPNGKKKASNSPMTISKMQLTEPPPNKPGTTSMKDLTKTSLYGSRASPKSLKHNTEISIKTSSRIQAIH